MPLRISLDRALPVAIGVQLRGQIEYGIVAGELRPGEQLPSVRELALRMEVAQMTVSQVYAALKRDGLIYMKPGKGAFVSTQHDSAAIAVEWTDLHRLVDVMVEDALERGFTPAEITRVMAMRLAASGARQPHVAIVGLFDRATRAYTGDVAALLADLDARVTAHTLARLREDARGDDDDCIGGADIVLTLVNKVGEVRRLLGPGHPPVQGLAFAAHAATIARLEALPAGVRLGLVSTFADFLPTMLQGVEAHTKTQGRPVCMVLSDVENLELVLTQADVVVYASGSEAIVGRLRAGVMAIEYLHTPEPSTIESLRPLLARIRGARATAAGKEKERDGLGSPARAARAPSSIS